jgi:hypothetical protein
MQLPEYSDESHQEEDVDYDDNDDGDCQEPDAAT